MSIQSNINQAMSIGAALYTQTPGYAIKKEEKLTQTKIEGLESKLAGYDEQLKAVNPAKGEDQSVRESLEAGKASLQKQLLKLDPSASRLRMYYEEQAIRRQEANDQAQGKKANRQEQMTGFAQHMANWGKGKRPKVGETNGK